jgi:hypothetical protein
MANGNIKTVAGRGSVSVCELVNTLSSRARKQRLSAFFSTLSGDIFGRAQQPAQAADYRASGDEELSKQQAVRTYARPAKSP